MKNGSSLKLPNWPICAKNGRLRILRALFSLKGLINGMLLDLKKEWIFIMKPFWDGFL